MLQLKSFLIFALLIFNPAFAADGSDGTVNILTWQAPSIMNTYLAGGEKDATAASLVLEPLASYSPDRKLFPRLAVDIPTVENGGVSKDLKSITWKLKPGLKWSDGTPVTAKDVVFTANYCMDPKAGCAELGLFRGVDKVEAINDLTVKVTFKEPTPLPYRPFVSSPIIQAKQFADCLGAKAPTCTEANFNPIGTGPFEVTSFKPNDSIQLKANPNYRDPDKPHFAEVNYKGGGDALATARAVLQTGEYDFGYNPVVAPDVLKKMEAAGKGTIVVGFGGAVETLVINLTDPSSNLPLDERSTAKHPNPILSDIRVRKALAMAIDRTTLAKIGYGFMGQPTCNLQHTSPSFAADNTSCLKQDIPGAKKLLDEAGWKIGGDGVREKDGRKLKLIFQTSTNAVRQQFQEIIKQWWREIGVDVELRNINPSVFFASGPDNPDTYQKFYADVEIFSFLTDTVPGEFMDSFVCDRAPRPATQWQGLNIPRYCDERYDALAAVLNRTADFDKREEIIQKLDSMVTTDSSLLVPLVWRAAPMAISNTLGGFVYNSAASAFWNIQDWYRKK